MATSNKKTVVVGDKTYIVNTKTGVVRDTSGTIVADAHYSVITGALTIGNETIDITPRTTPVAGEIYERNFEDTERWGNISHSGVNYYFNKDNGNVFTLEGQYVGTYKNGSFELFDLEAPEEEAPEGPDPIEQDRQRGLLADLSGLLSGLFDPRAVQNLLETVIKPAITQGLNEFEIMRLLRESETYKSYFPEYAARIENGYAAMDEGEILAWRDKAKQLSSQIWGVEATSLQIGDAIANNWSVEEFEHRLLVTKKASENPWVKQLIESELGRKLTPEEFMNFMDPEIDTAEFDELFESAFYRAMPAALPNLGIQTQATADRLKELGYNPDEAFAGWKQLSNALPSVDKLAAIDRAIKADADNPFDSLGSLFESIFAQDAGSQQAIAQLFAREGARFTGRGGVATAGGAALGSLTPDARRQVSA